MYLYGVCFASLRPEDWYFKPRINDTSLDRKVGAAVSFKSFNCEPESVGVYKKGQEAEVSCTANQ